MSEAIAMKALESDLAQLNFQSSQHHMEIGKLRTQIKETESRRVQAKIKELDFRELRLQEQYREEELSSKRSQLRKEATQIRVQRSRKRRDLRWYKAKSKGGVSSQAQSPLFQLPGEIREQIWDYVLKCGEVHLSKPGCKKAASQLRLPRNRASHPQLLETCRRAYNEGHTRFYEMNRFFVPSGKAIRTQQVSKSQSSPHVWTIGGPQSFHLISQSTFVG